jgi:hypothetical protein
VVTTPGTRRAAAADVADGPSPSSTPSSVLRWLCPRGCCRCCRSRRWVLLPARVLRVIDMLVGAAGSVPAAGLLLAPPFVRGRLCRAHAPAVDSSDGLQLPRAETALAPVGATHPPILDAAFIQFHGLALDGRPGYRPALSFSRPSTPSGGWLAESSLPLRSTSGFEASLLDERVVNLVRTILHLTDGLTPNEKSNGKPP